MANLNLICGVPASGKDTYLNTYHKDDYIVSRDNIRYSFLKDGEDYFAHENEVYRKFVETINYYGAIGDKDVWANQTNLNYLSRVKLLNNVQLSFFDKVNAYYILCNYETASKRNSLRKGRLRVPEKTLQNMFMSFAVPTIEEGFDGVFQIIT